MEHNITTPITGGTTSIDMILCGSASRFSLCFLCVSVPLWFRSFSKCFHLFLTRKKSSAVIRITALDSANRWRRRTSTRLEKTITALEKPELVSPARHATLKVKSCFSYVDSGARELLGAWHYPIEPTCQTLDVSRSGFYAHRMNPWLSR